MSNGVDGRFPLAYMVSAPVTGSHQPSRIRHVGFHLTRQKDTSWRPLDPEFLLQVPLSGIYYRHMRSSLDHIRPSRVLVDIFANALGITWIPEDQNLDVFLYLELTVTIAREPHPYIMSNYQGLFVLHCASCPFVGSFQPHNVRRSSSAGLYPVLVFG